MQRDCAALSASSPPSVLPTGRELIRNRAGRPVRDAAIIGVPSMYDSSEVKVFHQPDGGEG